MAQEATPTMFLSFLASSGRLCLRCMAALTAREAKFHRLHCKTDVRTGHVSVAGREPAAEVKEKR